MNSLLVCADTRSLQYPGAKSESKPVLSNISLAIHRGEKVALLGKSGSGKSTLLAHLRQQLASPCAWCPQAAELVPQLSVFHNIYSGGLNRHPGWRNFLTLCHPPAAVRRDIGVIATQLGLHEKLWQKAGELSGGQQQRVALGRAIYQQRPLLLADEPVSALDAHHGRELLAQLLQQHQTSVIALHQVELALALCDRIVGLANNSILFDLPAVDVTAELLAQLYRDLP